MSEPKQRFVYFIQAGTGAVKIGVAADPFKRLSELQTGNHEPLRIIATVEGDVEHESSFHARFASHRLRGEWFAAEPVLAALNRVHVPYKTEELKSLFIKCDVCYQHIDPPEGIVTWKNYDDEPGSYNHRIVHKTPGVPREQICDDEENDQSMELDLALSNDGIQRLVAFMLETNADAARLAGLIHRLLEATR